MSGTARQFSRMPVEVWADHRLTLKQIRVLGAILSFANKEGRCHPKREDIANRCGMLPRHVSTASSDLVKLGWLKKTGSGGFSLPVDYQIAIPTEEKRSPNQGPTTVPESGTNNSPRIRDGRTVPELGTVDSNNSPRIGDGGGPRIGDGGGPRIGDGQATDHITRPYQQKDLAEPVSEIPPQPRQTSQVSKPKKSSALTPEMQKACRETLEAYSMAYLNRYGVEPVRNSKVAGQVVMFVRRLGMTDAPHVARFYVGHPDAWYTRSGHSFDALLKDAEKLRTEWATNTRMTAATARQIDATQTNLNAAETAKAMLARRASGS